MDNFIVSARKYRPVTFESVVGQQHITNTLKNAIKNNQLAQAFLFCGPRGVGKTTCARILAKTINCTNLQPNGEACGTCDPCRSFHNGNSFNIHELDAASNNSVDDIRSLIEQVRIPPQGARYKVYIIDEVHMLSQAAFNAFLKTLEEPPHYAIFILATTEKHKILPTILSRCQIFDFNRISVEDMSRHLASIAEKEQVSYEDDGLHIIAQKADGGLRDALSMFDQIVSFSDGKVTYRSVIDNLNILDYDHYFKITDSLLKEETAKTLLYFDDILSHGFDGAHFISGLSEHFRNLLVGKDPSTLKLLEVSEGIRAKYLQQSQTTSVSFLLSALNIANQCDVNYKLSKNQRLQVELALLKMCNLPSVFNLATTPLTVMPETEGQLKKKPDIAIAPTPAPSKSPPIGETLTSEGIKDAKIETVNSDISVLSDPPATYATAKQDSAPSPKVSPPVGGGDIEGAKEESKAATPKAFIPNAHSPSTSIKIPSLKDIDKIADAAKEDDDPYLKGDAKEDFTLEAFVQLWNKHTSAIKADGRVSLYSSMEKAPEQIGPDLFEITVGTKVQETQFRDEKPALLNFIRSELKNFSIDVIVKVDEQAVVKKPYTNQEKFNHMATKNPELMELRKRFDLDPG